MTAVWAIFRGSLPLQFLALALAGWAAFQGNNYFQRQVGASTATAVTSAKAVESATDTIEIIRHAEETTPLIVEQKALQALCCKRASCRDRKKLMAEGVCK